MGVGEKPINTRDWALYTFIEPVSLLELSTNPVGEDLVPIYLHAGDGEGTTKGFEGGVTHGGVGGIEGGMEGLLGLDDRLHCIRCCRWWVSSSRLEVLLNGVVELNVTLLVVVDVDLKLNNTVEKHLQSAGGDPSATAVNAMKAIIKAEQAFHAALDASYTTMGDTTFKALRRALPITRMKIDWNKILTYRIGAQLTK